MTDKDPTTDDALFKEIEHLRASCPGVNSGQILSWMKWQDEVLCRTRDRIVEQDKLSANYNEIKRLCDAEIAALRAQLAERDAAALESRRNERKTMSAYHIVFDGPPEAEAGRFVEVEDDDGCSISVGEWREREDGLWELVIDGFDHGVCNALLREQKLETDIQIEWRRNTQAAHQMRLAELKSELLRVRNFLEHEAHFSGSVAFMLAAREINNVLGLNEDALNRPAAEQLPEQDA